MHTLSSYMNSKTYLDIIWENEINIYYDSEIFYSYPYTFKPKTNLINIIVK